jgi:hypothetical protein
VKGGKEKKKKRYREKEEVREIERGLEEEC